ncbi:MAG TPA: hypothetical protein VE572_04770 [Nitrososphaeraceae archaeon]|jgi:hypothetical protein|nr:hypothetical protein [Nitrososphaeraceae archaeon]
MLKTNISQKVAVVSLLVALTFAVAGLTAVTVLSESFAVAQGLGNDPISGCINTIGEGYVRKTLGDIQNWNESVQNFVSLITTDSTITLMNENIVHNGYPEDPAKPITDIPGIWDMLNDGNMTQYDRFHLFLTVVDDNLAGARPGFTEIQQIALSRCISDAVNTLGPTPSY